MDFMDLAITLFLILRFYVNRETTEDDTWKTKA